MNAVLALLLLSSPTADRAPATRATADSSFLTTRDGGRCIARILTAPDRRTPNRYSATRVLGLHFRAWSAPRRHSSRLRLRVYSPDGRVYGVIHPSEPAPPVVAGAGAGSDSASARPQRARLASRFVDLGLPIAGSQVMWGSLYGRWTAVPFLEGAGGRCGPPLHFTIRP